MQIETSSHDEIGVVAHSFNTMVNNLAESKQALIREQAQRLKAEKELQQRHKMEAVGSLAGGIAHNFNNNLAIILGNIELTWLKITSPEKCKEYLETAKVAILRSRDLIRQIMVYSRQENYQRIKVQPVRLLNETLNLLKPTIPPDVTIRQEISTQIDDVFIFGDKVQIQQALINLMTNSVYAMNGHGFLDITLSLKDIRRDNIPSQYEAQQGSYICFSVADNGCGIDESIIEKIFDPFFTTKEIGQGTGMGLATVRGIAVHHQGFIHVESVKGEGTCIHLYFPAETGKVTDVAESKFSVSHGTETVLFVDDEDMVSVMGKDMLESMGYQVSISTNAAEALDLFKENPALFDLVITDQIMPGMTGKELIKELKKNTQGPACHSLHRS